MKTPTLSPTRLVSIVSATIGLCILGDSLLYSILPLAAPQLGISLPLVGVLLSANRFVRILSNAPASQLFERWGPTRSFLVATVLGVISTFFYGIGWGFAVFLIARLAWGAAWSGLRQGGYQAVWTGAASSKGRLTGLLWGIVRLGSALGVLAGGLLYDWYGFRTTLLIVTAASTLAIPVALLIRWPVVAHPVPPVNASAGGWKNWLTTLHDPARRWLVVAGLLQLLLSSVVIATSSLLLKGWANGESHLLFGLGIGGWTGILQGLRWLSDITLGPTVGSISDRFGQARVAAWLVTLAAAAVLGMITLTTLPAMLCLLVILLCDSGLSVTLSAAASGAARELSHPHRFIGLYTTGGDIGSAFGPLAAFSIGQVIGLPVMYVVISGALLVAVWRYRMLMH